MHAWHNVAIADLESRPECVHRAYPDLEEERNGWACSYFEKQEVERVAAWLLEFDDGLEYDETTDTYNTTYDPDAPESFTGADIDGIHPYPIGNGSWAWTIVGDSAEESASPKDSK